MAQNKLTTRIVLRNDSTANWLASETQVLLKGEVGIEFLDTGKVKMKVGDGVKTWKDLPYFGGDECHVYEATVAKGEDHIAAITAVVGDAALNKGDIAIVKEAVIDADKLTSGVIQKYQYTAYVYGETASGTAWKAMDGNYSAKNVYFDEDFTFTKAIGTVTIPASGSTKVAAAGKNIPGFFAKLFAEEVAGTQKTAPYVSITLNGVGSYEVGEKRTPSFTAILNKGAYTYGPADTGIEASKWEVTSTAGESWSTPTPDNKNKIIGTGTEITIADDTHYSITAKATHGEGVPALSNTGNAGSGAFKFAAGSKSATSGSISGYRKQFYGAQVTPIDITSDAIRTLNSATPGATFNGKYAGNNKNGFLITVPEGCRQVVIALYGKTLKNVFDNAAFGTDIKGSFVEVSATSSVSIAGANNYTGVNYNVYVYAPAAALGANTYDCVIG